MGGILPFIPAALGVASSLGLFGKGAKEGKEIKYEAQAPEYQQQFAEEFFKYLQGQIGTGATPYEGQVAAPFVNPFTQGAFGAMQASPYGSMMGGLPMGGAPFVPPQQPPQTPQAPPQQRPQLPPGGAGRPAPWMLPQVSYGREGDRASVRRDRMR